MNNPVGWCEIYVEDMARARAFYEQVFGFQLTRLPDVDLNMWAFPMDPEARGISGALVQMPGFSPGGNSTLVYFSCDDCAEQERRAAEAGGKVEQSKMSIGQYGFISLVHDSEGNLIGLHSMR